MRLEKSQDLSIQRIHDPRDPAQLLQASTHVAAPSPSSEHPPPSCCLPVPSTRRRIAILSGQHATAACALSTPLAPCRQSPRVMGLFSSSTAPATIDGAPAPPMRSERAKCYAARDAYFACLDAHDIIDALAPSSKERATTLCRKQEAALERDCVTSWVTHFKQRRVADYKKAKLLRELQAEGAKEVPIGG